ncbi:MAG: GvpL/GvpF family gas vesicle protein [Candidatus Binatia bacterium]
MDRAGLLGIDNQGAEVRVVPFRDIGALVSHRPAVAYGSIPKEALLRHLAAHQSVIEQVMQNHTVIPMKFGTLLRDQAEVQDMLEVGYPQLQSALWAIYNKIEINVVATWSNLEAIIKELGKPEELRRFFTLTGEEIAARSAEEAKIELGRAVKAALDERRAKCAAEILEVLKDRAEDFSINDLMDDSMITNIAFLLDRDKEGGFDFTINKLNENYKERINFRCVGPLPPYSFATTEVKKTEFASIDEARKILELGEQAGLSEIKEAHRRLARQYHPDSNPGDSHATEIFKKISEAYALLTEHTQHSQSSFQEEKDSKDFITVKVLRLAEIKAAL